MDEKGCFVASLISASPRAFAAGATNRQLEAPATSAAGLGFNQLLHDNENRLRSLGESLAVGRPELFAREMAWLKSMMVNRQVDESLLQSSLRCLRDELGERLPAEAAPLAVAALESAMDALPAAPSSIPSQLEEAGPHAKIVRELLLSLLDGRRRRAMTLVDEALAAGMTPVELHDHVLTPAQAEIGRMWQHGEIDIAEEHAGTEICTDLLAILLTHTERREANGRRVLGACVAGNLHRLGLRMVLDRFEIEGWETIFLGADTPAPSLAQAVIDHEVHLVTLSVNLVLHLTTAARTIEVLKTTPETANIPVMVGGRPFTFVDDLWQVLGADGVALHAETAVAEGARLVDASG